MNCPADPVAEAERALEEVAREELCNPGFIEVGADRIMAAAHRYAARKALAELREMELALYKHFHAGPRNTFWQAVSRWDESGCIWTRRRVALEKEAFNGRKART